MRARSLEVGPFVVVALLLSALPAQAAGSGDPAHPWCGTSRWATANAIWAHREEVARRGLVREASAATSSDVGQVAVLKDQGDLVVRRRGLDLQGAGLQFTPGKAGFSVSRVDRPVAVEAGSRLALTDDSNVAVALPFSFPFFGQRYSQVFVNSDGNLTFGAGESSSADRSLGRLLGGPPRIAPLFADLNPETGGSITTFGDATHFSVTWTDVPQYGKSDKNTFQVALHADGRVDFAYDTGLTHSLDEGVVGVAPGHGQGGFTSVDFSAAAGVSGPGALAESFAASDKLDVVAVARKFYATHPDSYQQIIVFTSRPLGRADGYFAFELTVKNADTGIGAQIEDDTSEFGSAGRLESFVTMDFVSKYPEPFDTRFFGTDSPLSIMGQEVAHRWGAYALFKDGNTISHELLGRDQAHWSFFLDSDASLLEGNDIEDLGGGSFRTVAGTLRYSPLDQYIMGLRPAAEVPPFFLIRNPTGTVTDAEHAPQAAVSIHGVRKDITVGDVVAALGPRNPPPGPRPPFREVFVYVDDGTIDAAAAIAKVDRFRVAWEPFFGRSTEGRGAVDTRLN